MRQRLTRVWPALIVALLGLPLFVGLGRSDLQNDEAIYSFAVDRILETGDWLTPRSSPSETAAFLEKPPLKMWIVAAPMRLGLLPHDEFGLRFWDAFFGAVAFLYVLGIGRRLIGPIAGAAAALILFVHWPLVFDHGLRSNNMEAAVFLCYCGGVYHYMLWSDSTDGARRRRHAVALGLYFVLGFMTKFVAALFLPLVLGVATLLFRSQRAKLARDWRLFAAVAALVLALCAPWFLYAHLRFGAFFWETIFAEHVYARFTRFLDPMHLQPWNFYLIHLYQTFQYSNTFVLVVAGAVLMLVRTIRERWVDGFVVLLWFALPVTLISAGTSKLYHYVFPFLPPLALCGGYFVERLFRFAQPVFAAAVHRVERQVVENGRPRVAAALGRPAVRGTLSVIAVVALTIAVVTVVYGPIRLSIGRTVLLKNGGLLRPWCVAVVLAVLAARSRLVDRLAIPLVILWMLPLPVYRDWLTRLTVGAHPMRATVECIHRIQADVATPQPPGLYVDLPDTSLGHPLYYYFRRVRPWTRAESRSPLALQQYVNDPAERRPSLVWEPTYREFRRLDHTSSLDMDAAQLPLVSFPDDALLLLPGPYGACTPSPVRRREIP